MKVFFPFIILFIILSNIRFSYSTSYLLCIRTPNAGGAESGSNIKIQYSSLIYGSPRLECTITGGISVNTTKCCSANTVGTNTTFSNYVNFAIIMNSSDGLGVEKISLETTNNDGSVSTKSLTKFLPKLPEFNICSNINTVTPANILWLDGDGSGGCFCSNMRIHSTGWNDEAVFSCHQPLW